MGNLFSVDLIYGIYDTQNNENVLAADASKGIITKQNNDITRGADWIVSQRAVILLTERQIVCGKWQIPIDNISNATLVIIKSLFGGGQVLKVQTLRKKGLYGTLVGLRNNKRKVYKYNPDYLPQLVEPLFVCKQITFCSFVGDV